MMSDAAITAPDGELTQPDHMLLVYSLISNNMAVAQMTYPGVTHEFFGMGALAPRAREVITVATDAFRAASEAQQKAPTRNRS